MLALKINDPYVNKRLAIQARMQGKSRQSIAVAMLHKHLEDAEDYAATTAVMADIENGITAVISSEEMWTKWTTAKPCNILYNGCNLV